MSVVTDYTALLTGSYWSGIEVTAHPVFVTYSFDATAPASDQANLSPSAYATFAQFTAAQQLQTQQALQEWSDDSGIVFLQVAPGQGEINFAAYDFSTDPNAQYAGGMAFYPWGNWNYATYPYFSADLPGSGNVLMNTAFTTAGDFAYVTLLHEIGHAIGLKHPYESWSTFAAEHNTWDTSSPAPVTVMNEGATSLTHLATLDIQAIQSIYGTQADQGGTDASWSWNAGTETLTQYVKNTATAVVRGVATNNVIRAGSGTDMILGIGAGTNKLFAGAGASTLVSGSGTNFLFAGAGAGTFIGTFGATTLEYANLATPVTIDLLHPWLNAGAAADDTLIDIHNVWGSKAGDSLTGDDAGDVLKGLAGTDTIIGGTGNDTIDGGTGADSMAGGTGDDTYYIDNVGDVVTEAAGAGSDTIFTRITYALVAGNSVEFLRASVDTGIRLTGNEIANSIRGGAGNDTLIGGGGGDTLVGGGGADQFRLSLLADSTTDATGRDRIIDFSAAEGDTIDLHIIDAVAHSPGNQAFTFIGTAAFSGAEGELRYAPSGPNTLLTGDVNGDKLPDFAIILNGAHSFTASNFIL